MFRVSKPLAATLAVLALAVASACTGSVASPNSNVLGITSNDPNVILNSAVRSESTVKSFHVAVTLDGTVDSAVFSKAMGGSTSMSGPLALTGSTLEGDVDVAGRAAHVTFSLPAVSANGDLIVVDKTLYYKVNLLGDKYHQVKSAAMEARPTPDASEIARALADLERLRGKLDAAGAQATLIGIEQIDGKDAYHINYKIPVDYINSQISAHESADPGAVGSAWSSFRLDSDSADIWVYKDDGRLAKAQVKASSAQIGRFDAITTITKYDQPVTILPPVAGDIETNRP